MQLQDILDKHTDPWGIKVTSVEVKHVDLPAEMTRALAKQAEAEREKRAKIIHADGEFEASDKLAAAAKIVGQHPMGIQLTLSTDSYRKSQPKRTRRSYSHCRSI